MAVLKSICPTMPSRDFTATKAFYARLGFTIGSEYDAEGYLILERNAAELHFFRHPDHTPETSDHGAYVRVDDTKVLSAEFASLGLPAAGIPRFAPAEDKRWGMCELAIVDPDGNLLRFGHRL